jgi:phage terminase small subunit
MLTQKQETFCLKYFELGNTAEAARIAGYSPRTAREIGRENLGKPAIQARLQELRQAAEDATIMSVVERKQRLTQIARANIPDYVDKDGIRVDKESPNVGAVSEITTKTKVFKKTAEPVIITNLKLHNPIQAISELNKMEKVYETAVNINQDNRTINIIVQNPETRDMLTKIGDRLLEQAKDDK